MTTVTNGMKKVGLAPNLTSGFYGQDIISVRQFTRENLEYIFAVADEMRAVVKRVGSTDLLKGHVLACVFYEPSTRTSSSFIAAMSRLGGSVIPINEVRFSSVTKGESLPDTIRTLARLDLAQGLQEVLDIVAGFPGALQLLPAPGFIDTDGRPPRAFYERATWDALAAINDDFWFGKALCGRPSQARLEEAIDRVRARYGKRAVHPATPEIK